MFVFANAWGATFLFNLKSEQGAKQGEHGGDSVAEKKYGFFLIFCIASCNADYSINISGGESENWGERIKKCQKFSNVECNVSRRTKDCLF